MDNNANKPRKVGLELHLHFISFCDGDHEKLKHRMELPEYDHDHKRNAQLTKEVVYLLGKFLPLSKNKVISELILSPQEVQQRNTGPRQETRMF